MDVYTKIKSVIIKFLINTIKPPHSLDLGSREGVKGTPVTKGQGQEGVPSSSRTGLT